MKLEFGGTYQACNDDKSFDAVTPLPRNWKTKNYDEDAENEFIVFTAYDKRYWAENNERAKKCEYICDVDIHHDSGDIERIASFPAQDRADAERLLQLAANAIYQ